MPPLHDIAHLAHLELHTPVLDESVAFFADYLGLTVADEAGGSVFLRAFDDYEHTTHKLTAHETSGIGRTNLRAASPEALDRLVAAVTATGRGLGWVDGDPGVGPTYLFTDPEGHEFGIYYESEWYRAPAELAPSLKNQAQAYPARGVGVRRRDAVYTRDRTGTPGRLHHIAFAVDTRADILRAADIAIDQGVFIETGPHKHAIQQTVFLYVYEPAGNRIELCNAGARLVLAPDWEPVDWTEAERAKGQAWGLQTIESFHTHGTPPVPAP